MNYDWLQYSIMLIWRDYGLSDVRNGSQVVDDPVRGVWHNNIIDSSPDLHSSSC